ncbi:Hsp70 family protein [Nocardia cyriacigeorgica]|uniref:Hsp70 family protein n=1 Tax=Nocardia cyriacigeorgica TaxID=135487 RepID=UPI00189457CF|nr:Hsp70 family protein [Nocardia cyriacigeorgica]MBF6453082.1 Hsp70 family protein [Nocardia cyriacigeorgica]MBF6481694.1 Hsp70 family protein [Nocardia cyriacigeorgica]MBF6550251.1 Hsp70 family protein [Nocardia cyriacigeorgica]
MTQRLALGITVGSANSVAVLASRDGEPGIDSASVLTHPTVLRLVPGAPALFGTEAIDGGRHAPGVRIDGFVSRVGDPVPMLADDGTSHTASDLVATAITRLVEESADPGATVVACHPAHWTAHTVSVLRTALDDAGAADVALIPEPVAAVRWSCTAGRTTGDGAVLVYDLGATGLTVSVVRTGDRIELLGTPVHSTDIAGAEFDLLTMRYVLANAPTGIDADPFDPAVERELSALRERCRIAKEELSTHTATVVTTGPDGATVRLVRDELEDLLRAPLRDSMHLIRDAVHRAGIDIGDVHQVLLTGGGGAIGLLAELISSEFGLPVVSAAEPAHTSALGASAFAADLADTAVETVSFAAIGHLPDESDEPATESVRPVSAPTPLPLPVDTRKPGAARTRRRRIAIVAAAAAALGLLATGTVAVSTGAGTGTQHPAAPEHTSSSTAGTPGTAGGPTTAGAGSAATGGTAGTVADAGTSKDGAAQANPSTPGAVTVVNSQREGAPAGPAGSAPSPAAPGPGQAPQPAPQAPAPAPQAPPPGPQSPPPGPAPQPPAPAPQQPPAQTPKLPTDGLTDTLGETVEGVGGTVGTVLRAPGEILGGSGG